jgi:tryptophan synthase alpha chain
MVAPTSGERVKNTCKDAQGFIYLVSSMGVTGVRDKIVTDIGAIVRTIKEVTATPVCVGFGISTTEQAKDTAAVADGVIVGSAIVRIIAEYGEKAEEELYRYIRAMATSVHGV